MIPRSRAEARDIIKIVQFFRIAAYPELGAGNSEKEVKGQQSIEMSTFKFPDIFEITYLTNGKKNKNMIQQIQSYLIDGICAFNL